jgi:fatty-acyl-CoA synthase
LENAPTPSRNSIPTRLADFATLAEALDYAAEGETGCNFYDARGRLVETLPYSELRERALALARGLMGLGLSRGDRVAAIAETDVEFTVVFFACQYAGLVPVALPISLNVGGRGAYVEQLCGLVSAARPTLVTASDALLPFLEEAAQSTPWIPVYSIDDLEALEPSDEPLIPSGIDDVAYLQFTSGSTSFPRGVVVRQHAVMSNLRGIVRTGLEVRGGDRCASWLPFYHDMGLVGFLLGPLVSQVSVDYLKTRDFAVRPLSWLRLISRNRATIAFGPPISYQLCARKLRRDSVEELDLSRWRIAGVGAEMIRRDVLEEFARALAPAGFDPGAFLPCYGLAEASLAVSFSTLGSGVRYESISAEALALSGDAVLSEGRPDETTEVVNCGHVLPGHEVQIRGRDGTDLGLRRTGRVMLRGPSLMEAYFEDPVATETVFSDEHWLDTGDLGYLTPEGLFITGRTKDLIIINGRNIWPQDLEYLAEREDAVRAGDASAFSVLRPEGGEQAVLVIQCRMSSDEERVELVSRIQRSVYSQFGLRCEVDLVAPGTLPKTSSGKLSRADAKRGYLDRMGWDGLQVTSGATTA